MMKPFRSTLPLDEALALVREAVVPIARTERVPIERAHDRVLASTVIADADVPSFDRSAMDGYAVVAADTQGASRQQPVTLRLAGRLYAGDRADGDVAMSAGADVCVEIATGAPLPAGADAVVMVEETALASSTAIAGMASGGATPPSGAAAAGKAAAAGDARPVGEAAPGGDATAAADAVQVFAEVRPGQHVVRRAADMRRGDVVIEAGTALEPSRVGALAAIGIAEVDVFAKPVVAILPTGNELVRPGQPLPPGHVYDVNRYTIGGLVERHGGVAVQLPTLVDTPEAVREALVSATAASAGTATATSTASGRPTDTSTATAAPAGPIDLLILCGGSSVGERDLVIDALREQGEVLFHGLAVKPGKPTAFARLGTTLVLGMPGNPTSCLSNAYVLMIPLLRALGRLPPLRPTVVRVPIAQRVTSTRGRLQFLPVRLADDGRAVPTFKGSGEITSLSRADGYVTIAADTEVVDADTPVDVTLY